MTKSTTKPSFTSTGFAFFIAVMISKASSILETGIQDLNIEAGVLHKYGLYQFDFIPAKYIQFLGNGASHTVSTILVYFTIMLMFVYLFKFLFGSSESKSKPTRNFTEYSGKHTKKTNKGLKDKVFLILMGMFTISFITFVATLMTNNLL